MKYYKNGKELKMTAAEEAEWLASQPTAEELHNNIKNELIKQVSNRTLDLIKNSSIEPSPGIYLHIGGPENQSRWILIGVAPSVLTYPYSLTAYDENDNRIEDYVVNTAEEVQALFGQIVLKEQEIRAQEKVLINLIKNINVGEVFPDDLR